MSATNGTTDQGQTGGARADTYSLTATLQHYLVRELDVREVARLLGREHQRAAGAPMDAKEIDSLD